MKEFIRVFMVVVFGGMLFAITFLTVCFVLFGADAEIHWEAIVKIVIVCIIGLGVAFLFRDKK